MDRLLAALALAAALAGCSPDAGTSVAADPAPDPAYDRYRRPDLLLAALDLHPGQIVADVGAGSGYLTFRLAEAVGASGRIVATDIDDRALRALAARAARRRLPQLETRHVAAADPGLTPQSFDRVLLAEVDHLLPDRAAWLRRAASSLKNGGRIAITNRRSFQSAALDAARAANLCPISETNDLPGHFLLQFEVRSPCP